MYGFKWCWTDRTINIFEAKGENSASIYKLNALNRLKIKDNKMKNNDSKYMTLKIEGPIGKTIMGPLTWHCLMAV